MGFVVCGFSDAELDESELNTGAGALGLLLIFGFGCDTEFGFCTTGTFGCA